MRLTSLNTGPVIQVIGRTAGADLGAVPANSGQVHADDGLASKRSRAAVKTLGTQGHPTAGNGAPISHPPIMVRIVTLTYCFRRLVLRLSKSLLRVGAVRPRDAMPSYFDLKNWVASD